MLPSIPRFSDKESMALSSPSTKHLLAPLPNRGRFDRWKSVGEKICSHRFPPPGSNDDLRTSFPPFLPTLLLYYSATQASMIEDGFCSRLLMFECMDCSRRSERGGVWNWNDGRQWVDSCRMKAERVGSRTGTCMKFRVAFENRRV